MPGHRLQADIDAYVLTTGNSLDIGGAASNDVVADTISEATSGSGVTVDSLLIKDGQVQGTAPILADTISEKTSATGVTVDGVLLKDSAVTASGGVTSTGRSEFTSIGPAAAIAAGGDTLAVTEALHAGGVIAFGKTTGTICTLPAATGTGNIYRFVIATAATSNANIIKVANATDVMDGSICVQQDTDADGTSKVYRADAGDDTMNFAGAAGTGGIVGGYIECVDYASGFWSCRAFIQSGGGAEVTPFDATVS